MNKQIMLIKSDIDLLSFYWESQIKYPELRIENVEEGQTNYQISHLHLI